MSADDYRAASQAQWDGAAGAWERHAERLDTGAAGVAAAWLLDAAGPGPGADVLELACGPGGVGLAAARLVGPEGRVVCTDFAPSMVEAAGRRAEALGLDNVEARVLDAERMDLEDASFDAVLCRFGYMLMADPAAALSETLRVLRPGGRLALAVWAEMEANPWIAALLKPAMEHSGAPPPDPDAPGIFALADEERLTGLMRRAGFEDIHTERLEAAERHPSPQAWWDFATDISAPARALLDAMDDESVAAVRSAAFSLVERHRDDDGLALPSAVRVATARRPA